MVDWHIDEDDEDEDRNAIVTVSSCEFVRETELAILIRHGLAGRASLSDITREPPEFVEVWLPKSQIENCDVNKPGDFGDVEIPRWLAEERGLG